MTPSKNLETARTKHRSWPGGPETIAGRFFVEPSHTAPHRPSGPPEQFGEVVAITRRRLRHRTVAAVTEPSLDWSGPFRKSRGRHQTPLPEAIVSNFPKYLALNLAAAAALAALAGCGESSSSGNGGVASNTDVGNVGLARQLTPGVVVKSFDYAISGPKSYTGTIDVSSSTKVSTIIGGITAGAGYSLTLTGMSADGQPTCAGASALFAVMAGGTTAVAVAIDCHVGGNKTGSVQVNGTINVCPNIDSVASNPPVGNTIAIAASASDPDVGPGALSYSWPTSAGTLSSATARNPALTCTAAGNVDLVLTVSDGDAGCNARFDLTVACPSDAAALASSWVEIGASNQAIARADSLRGLPLHHRRRGHLPDDPARGAWHEAAAHDQHRPHAGRRHDLGKLEAVGVHHVVQ